MQDLVLIHHGVKGMKWGVRRYQNRDGSLTAAGKSRYSVGTDRKRERLVNNLQASKEFASANKRFAKKAESRASNSKHAVVRGLNRIEAAHSRSQQKMWDKEAKKDEKRLAKYDKRIAKKRKNLQLNVKGSKAFSEANQRRIDDALKRAGSTKVSALAPGVGLLKKGAFYLEAAQARGQKRIWDRELNKDRRKLERFNEKHGA